MAGRPSGSYTVVIIPLRTSLYSLDALRFYLWRLKDLEREKDALCSGLEILEKAHAWYLQRLDENRARQDDIETESGAGTHQEGEAEVLGPGRSMGTTLVPKCVSKNQCCSSIPAWFTNTALCWSPNSLYLYTMSCFFPLQFVVLV
uniref:Suppressor APC domain containing 1 n=1 Tax=Labrus bergylta TaxID=56723 RepID=A0A3Q3GXS0_9LABR